MQKKKTKKKTKKHDLDNFCDQCQLWQPQKYCDPFTPQAQCGGFYQLTHHPSTRHSAPTENRNQMREHASSNEMKAYLVDFHIND